jgi:hypothetical protein
VSLWVPGTQDDIVSPWMSFQVPGTQDDIVAPRTTSRAGGPDRRTVRTWAAITDTH